MSLNGYGWVEGNTPNTGDPTGEFAWFIPIAIGLGVAAIVTAIVAANYAIQNANRSGASQNYEDLAEAAGKLCSPLLYLLPTLLNPPVVPPWYPPPISIPRPRNGPISLPVNPPIDNPDDRVDDLDRVIPIPREREDEDNDCLSGKTSQEAAQEYADIARYDYMEQIRDPFSGSYPPMTIAVTRSKDPSTDECRYYVAVNNVLSDYSSSRVSQWNQALPRLDERAMDYGTFPVIIAERRVTRQGSNSNWGHAERNLYDILTQSGTSVVAIGLSKRRCRLCVDYFDALNLTIPVAFYYNDAGEY
jgi:hypothetical protein